MNAERIQPVRFTLLSKVTKNQLKNPNDAYCLKVTNLINKKEDFSDLTKSPMLKTLLLTNDKQLKNL